MKYNQQLIILMVYVINNIITQTNMCNLNTVLWDTFWEPKELQISLKLLSQCVAVDGVILKVLPVAAWNKWVNTVRTLGTSGLAVGGKGCKMEWEKMETCVLLNSIGNINTSCFLKT